MDTQRYDELYREMRRPLLMAMYALTGDRAEAEDVVQEAFIRAWLHRNELDERAGAWVRTVATRLAISRWRKFGRGRPSGLDLESVGDLTETFDLDSRLDLVRALRKLPRDQRQALSLYHFLDMSVRDIATTLRLPEGTIRARLHRARAALRDHLAFKMPETTDGRTSDGDTVGTTADRQRLDPHAGRPRGQGPLTEPPVLGRNAETGAWRDLLEDASAG